MPWRLLLGFATLVQNFLRALFKTHVFNIDVSMVMFSWNRYFPNVNSESAFTLLSFWAHNQIIVHRFEYNFQEAETFSIEPLVEVRQEILEQSVSCGWVLSLVEHQHHLNSRVWGLQ